MDLNAIKRELEWFETGVILGRTFTFAELRQQIIQPLLDGYDRWQRDLDQMNDEKTRAENESEDLRIELQREREDANNLASENTKLRERIAELEARPVPVTYDDVHPGIWPGGGLDPDSEMD
jgi:predicted  nucleic acid-binding Zn-ribbon protein